MRQSWYFVCGHFLQRNKNKNEQRPEVRQKRAKIQNDLNFPPATVHLRLFGFHKFEPIFVLGGHKNPASAESYKEHRVYHPGLERGD